MKNKKQITPNSAESPQTSPPSGGLGGALGVAILAFFFSSTAYSQVDVGNNLVTGRVDTTRSVQNLVLKNRVKVPKNSIVFNLGYNFPVINNSFFSSDFWNKKTGTGFDFSVDYRKQFQKNVIEDDEVISAPTQLAFGIGLGISYFHKSAGFENFSETLTPYTDVDGDNCTVYLSYRNVNESVSLTYLDIPFYIEIGKPSRIKPSAYLKLGIKASILLSKKFEGEGTYTSTGYYQQWDSIGRGKPWSNIDHLGYYTDKSCISNLENQNEAAFKASPFVLWGTISAGVNFPFSSLEKNKLAKWIVRISAKMDYSLTPVSKSMEESYFKGAQFRLNQSNMMGGDGSRIFNVGISVGLIYCL